MSLEEHHGKGGSYERQEDGSLKLITRTEEAKPASAPATAAKKVK